MAERRRPRGKPSDDVYTVLIAIALVVLICGVGYVWYRNYQLTGNANPFQLRGDQNAARVLTNDGHYV